MQHSELPKPLGPNLEWKLALLRSGATQYNLQYNLDNYRSVVACLLWRPNRGWLLYSSNLYGLSLGNFDDPPFREAEVLYYAAQ